MAIPDFQSLMLPLMRHFQDGNEHANADTKKVDSDYFSEE